MYIKSAFSISAAANTLLLKMGFVPTPRMNGGSGWDNSITLTSAQAEQFIYARGNPATAGHVKLVSES